MLCLCAEGPDVSGDLSASASCRCPENEVQHVRSAMRKIRECLLPPVLGEVEFIEHVQLQFSVIDVLYRRRNKHMHLCVANAISSILAMFSRYACADTL